MIKAELVQASINKQTGDLVYTFRLSWKNIGMCFTFLSRPKGLIYAFNMIPQAKELLEFATKVLKAIHSGRTIGVIGKKECDRAVELFGSRVQDVLKIYNIGEYHMPYGMRSIHNRKATPKGWE